MSQRTIHDYRAPWRVSFCRAAIIRHSMLDIIDAEGSGFARVWVIGQGSGKISETKTDMERIVACGVAASAAPELLAALDDIVRQFQLARKRKGMTAGQIKAIEAAKLAMRKARRRVQMKEVEQT